ncbi:MAG: MjaI family restriction endonuclease, partial [Bacteroidales bacterium]
MKLKIKNNELQEILAGGSIDFPKYSTQIINLGNQNAQGTRPKVVGQMSDLIQEFDGKTLAEWKKWYNNKMPNAIENATDKIYPMVENFKSSITKIDRELIRQWVEDLVIVKTFTGLKFQAA